MVSQRPTGPFEDGAESGRVRETGPLSSVFAQFAHPYLSIKIAFAGSPVDGDSVLDTLDRIRGEVAVAIDALTLLVVHYSRGSASVISLSSISQA